MPGEPTGSTRETRWAAWPAALDGVLIGAGDNRFLAMASVVTTGVFVVCAYAWLRAGGGLTGLWLAIGAFMVARLVALGLRARSPAWAVTGARRS